MSEKYYHTKKSVEEYANLAKDVNGAELIKKYNKFLSPNSSLLEIGTGPGSDWEILNKNYSVIGSDNSKEFISFLHSKYPSENFIELDAVTLKVSQNFDGLYSNKVMHHLKDNELIKSIKRQYEILNPKGIICHSFWKGEGSEIFKGLFVNYHSEEDLKEFFGLHFEILYIKSYAEFEENDSILLIGRKKDSL
jgi:cyclopropane fatty-acyl-phospholipid synthase-like methyltransferase